jgi:NAD(P)-dependent dehydrogenase (short-subunit alcohol dehydrogenase family)
MSADAGTPGLLETGGEKWAVVLGVSSGVGAAVARELSANAGFHIFGVHRGRWPEDAAGVAEAVRSAGRQCVFWEADAGSAAGAEAGIAELRAHLGNTSASTQSEGPVAVLIHSLASAAVGPLAVGEGCLAPRQIESTFDRMAHSFVYWTRGLLDAGLLRPDARILGLNNIMTRVVVRQTAAVAASKAALEQYCKHLAFELGPSGRRVNLLRFAYAPTVAATRTFGAEHIEHLSAVMRRGTPAGRLCGLEEVAAFVRVLVGADAGWFNGADIDFTGAESQSFFDALVHP